MSLLQLDTDLPTDTCTMICVTNHCQQQYLQYLQFVLIIHRYFCKLLKMQTNTINKVPGAVTKLKTQIDSYNDKPMYSHIAG